ACCQHPSPQPAALLPPPGAGTLLPPRRVQTIQGGGHEQTPRITPVVWRPLLPGQTPHPAAPPRFVPPSEQRGPPAATPRIETRLRRDSIPVRSPELAV